ncbi:spore germination protein [Sutcliffiella halmapala]|uniref:spore germination protein n=1 Tax=Sutcliffiella halmapala TaxID=79882 RepID=UPI00099590B4|nr:spore germination protein [Sutcliffiella halmapala]
MKKVDGKNIYPSEVQKNMLKKLKDMDDFNSIEFDHNGILFSVMYLETIVDLSSLNEYFFNKIANLNNSDVLSIISSVDSEEIDTPELLTKKIVNGKFGVHIHGMDSFFSLNLPSKLNGNRSIQEPENEAIIRGAHDGFIEDLHTNILLIRKRIRHEDLKVKYTFTGRISETKGALLYIDGIANPSIIKEIERRLSFIDIDMVIDPGFIEEFIEDDSFSIFPQTLNTERPDKVMSSLMEGKVIHLSSDSPTALIIPSTFNSFFQSPDDYSSRWISGTFIRLLRFMAMILAINLPAVYIAISAFHFEVIPHELLLPLKGSVEGIPYPPLIEALIMEVTFELVREAGIRLPKPIGQTIGIVGGLVIGDAVVNAGIVSNIMIVVVAITAISSFVVPNNEMSTTIRLLRFPLMILASLFGFIGLIFGQIFILVKLTQQESFGVPYFTPFAPLNISELKDSIIRAPLWLLNRRPLDAKPQNIKRQKKHTRDWKKQDEY